MSEIKKIQESLSERSHGAYPTASPVGDGKWAQDVKTFAAGTVTASDAVDSFDSLTNEITAAGHVAIAGNILRFTSGALNGREFTVYSVTTNEIKLSEDVGATPPAPADTFDVLAPITQTLTSTGGVSAVNTFILDGVNQEVTEDTVTPANNRPLPVKLVSTTGDINITANDLNVELSHTSDTVRLGDGTDLTQVTAAGELNVIDSAGNAILTTIDADTGTIVTNTGTIAGDTTSIDGKLVDGNDIGDVTINNGVGAAAVNIQDGNNSITVDDGGVALTVDSAAGALDVQATDLDIRNLTHVASQDSVRIGDGTELVNVNASNELQVRDDDAVGLLTTIDSDTSALASTVAGSELQVDVVTSALPSGAATSALQTTGNTSLATIAGAVSGVEMQVDVVAPLPAGTNNIGDVDLASAIPAGTNSIGNVGIDHLTTVDFFDTPLLDASVTDIPSATFRQVVASTAAAISKIQVFDTTGEFYGIYTGVASSETLVAIVGPGSNETIEVSIASGERITLQSLTGSDITTGNVAMNFLG